MRKLLLLCAIMLATVVVRAQDINLLDQTAPAEFDMYSRPAEGVYAIKVMSKGYTGWMYNEGATYRMTTNATLSSLPKTYLWKVTHLNGENLGSFTLTCLYNDVALTAQTLSHNISNTQPDAVVAILKGERNSNVKNFEGINIYQRNYTAEQMTIKGDGPNPYLHTNDGNNSFRYLSYWVGGFNSNASTGTACVFQFYPYAKEFVSEWKETNSQFLGYVGGYPTSSAEDLNNVTDYADMLAFQAENEMLGINPDKYYRLVCVRPKDNDGDSNYNTLTFDGTSNLVTAPEDNSKVSQIFKFEPVDDADGKYMLVSPNTGLYLNKINQGDYRSALVGKGDACKLEIIAHAGVICQYKLHNSESHDKHCLFAENHPGERVPYACSGWDDGADSPSAWYLKVVDKLNFTIGSAGWATTHLPFDVVMPETVKAYAVESTSAESATLTQKDDIPAGEGAILEGQGTHTLTIAKASSDWTENKLEGTNVDQQVTGPAYVLSMPKGEKVGLYPAKLTNGQFKNNANKAYLPASAVASDARFFVFSFGDDMETGITETENENVKTENGEVYDLSGRRVLGVQKGIFIVNGKKVVR